MHFRDKIKNSSMDLGKTNMYTFYAYLALITIGLLWFKPAGFIAVLLLPAYLLLSPRPRKILIEAPHIFLINIGLVILQATTLNLFKINITYSSLVFLNLFVVTLFLIWRYLDDQPQEKKKREKASNLRVVYFIYGLFALAFIARVLSVINFHAPILHDPFSHAEWAQDIVQTGAIDYFYSPGLHILTAFTQLSDVAFVAKGTLVYSNFFSAFTVLSWSLYALKATNKKYFAGVLAFLILIAPTPAYLNLNAGKNALVMSIAFMPMAFYALSAFIKTRSWGSVLLSAFSVSLIGLIHYPSFAYMLAIFAVAIISKCLHSLLNKNVGAKDLFIKAFSLAGGVLFIVGFWLIHTLTFRDSPGEIVLSNTPVTGLSLENIYNFLKGTFSKFSRPQLTGFLFNLGVFTAILNIIGPKDKDKIDSTGPSLLFFSVVVLSFTLHFLHKFNIINFEGLAVLADTGYLFGASIFALPVAFFLAKYSEPISFKRWHKLVLGGLLAVFLILFSATQWYKYYTEWSHLNPVSDNDIRAFEWINKNIDDDEGFIVDSFKFSNDRKPNVVFAGLSGLWIPTYTNNPITADFQFFNLKSVHENHNYYSNIKKGESVYESIRALNLNGYVYYYHDDGPFTKALDIGSLTTVEGLTIQLMYENRDIKIYSLTALK